MIITAGRLAAWFLLVVSVGAGANLTQTGGGRKAGVTVTPTELTTVDEAALFAFDDVSIPFAENLVLTMHAPRKHPNNPVLPMGKRGDPDEFKIDYTGTVLRHAGKFKLWYIAVSRGGYLHPSSGRDIDFSAWRIAYAESDDGVRWTKPKLGIEEFRGSKDNNLIGLPEGFRGYNAVVLHDPDERDPSRQFKMLALLTQFGRYKTSTGKGAYVLLYSADGLRWRVADELLQPDGKTIAAETLARMEGSGIYKWKGLYYLSGQGALASTQDIFGRYVQSVRSADLLRWSSMPVMAFARADQYRRPKKPDPAGEADAVEQTHLGVSAWNRGNVLLGVTGMWHGTGDWNTTTHDLQFLVSNDGVHFREPVPDFVFAAVGQDGRDWDVGGLTQGQGFENVGDETYIWYGQMDQRQGTFTGRPWKSEGGVGLLVLERDRFGSLSIRDPRKPGGFLTSDLALDQAGKVWVNAAGLSARSSLQVELLDRFERPIEAYSGKNAARVEGSGLRVPVIWPGRERIEGMRESFKIRVRFEGDERSAIEFFALYLEAVP